LSQTSRSGRWSSRFRKAELSVKEEPRGGTVRRASSLFRTLHFDLAARDLHLELELVVQRVCIDFDVVATQNLAVENLDCQRVLNQALDGSFQWASAVRAIVAGEHQLMLRLGAQLDSDVAVCQLSLKVLEPEIDDVRQLLFAQRTEDDEVVDAVQKLRTEVLPQDIHHLLARPVERRFRCQ
jgi:hypothetical protein